MGLRLGLGLGLGIRVRFRVRVRMRETFIVRVGIRDGETKPTTLFYRCRIFFVVINPISEIIILALNQNLDPKL